MAKKTAAKPKPAPRASAKEQAAAVLSDPVTRTLDQMLGQERAVGVLGDALRSGRVHHAWIFHGPQGVGKFTTALAFAAALLDPNGVPGRGAASEAGELLRRGVHPDLHVVRKELAALSEDRSVRESKQITIPREVVQTHLIDPALRSAVLRGSSRATKVFIVDQAEVLDRSLSNATNQNAILKLVEEPPAGCVLILVTSAPERLLPTLRSRCQRVAFGPLPQEAMSAWLRVAGIEVPAPDRALLLEYAQGSPGLMLRALECGLASWHRALSPMLAQAQAGRFSPLLGPAMAGLIEEWAKGQAEASKQASKDAANRAGVSIMARLLAQHARVPLRSGDRIAAARAEGALRAVDRAEALVAAGVGIPFVMHNLARQLAGPEGGEEF